MFSKKRHVLAAFAQGRDLERDDVQTVEQIGAEIAVVDQVCQAACLLPKSTRTSTETGVLLPTGSKRCSSSTRTSLPAHAATYRRSHPKKASLRRRSRTSLSSIVSLPKTRLLRGRTVPIRPSSSGIAAEFISTNGEFLRFDCAWIARATSSLPVPLSPEIKTRPSVGATMAICFRNARIATDSPTITYCSASSDLKLLIRDFKLPLAHGIFNRNDYAFQTQRLFDKIERPEFC